MRRLLFCIPILLLLFSCGKKPIRIMVDPWMQSRIEPVLDSIGSPWRGHPIEVRYRSTEVAAEFIRQGEPIDIWGYATGDQLFAKEWPQYGGGGVWEDHPVRVRCPIHPDQKAWKTSHCLALSADDRPLRILADAWGQGEETDSCLLIADFPHQLKAYAKRGWTSEAILWESAAGEMDLLVLEKSELSIWWVIGKRYDEFSPKARKEVTDLSYLLEQRLGK